jgi:hypothetical protein
MSILFYAGDGALPFPPEVPWTETFTGTNGDLPNQIYWTEGNNGPQIQNNALRLSCGPGAVSGRMVTRFNISGDFSVSVDWDVISGFNTGSDGWAAVLEIFIDINNRFYMYQNAYSADLRMTCATWAGGARVNYFGPTGNSSGKFRIRRSGSTWYGDYDVGGGWVNLGSRGTGSGDTTLIRLETQIWGSYPSATVDWDNFTITQGTLIAP